MGVTTASTHCAYTVSKKWPLRLQYIFYNLWEFLHEILNDYAKFTPTRDRQVLLKNTSGIDEVMQFRRRRPHFSAFRVLSSAVLCGLLWEEPVCWCWGCRLGDGQSDCRCSEWPPLAATQAVKCLVKFATALLMCSCCSSSQVVCRAIFDWVYGVSLAWRPETDNLEGSYIKSLGHLFFSMNSEEFILQPALDRCLRREILTRKVGYTDLVFGVRSGFISR